MCRLQRILQGLALVLLPFYAVQACNININSSTGFTIQRYVNESSPDFDSDSVQWTISPCNDNSESQLVITCAKYFTLQNVENHKLIDTDNRSDGEGLLECRGTTSLKLNIFGCLRVRAKSVVNVTIEDCVFTSPLEADWQTMLDFSSTNATVKNCSFTSVNNDTVNNDPMITASETILVLVDSEFVTRSGKMLYIEQGSEVNITDATFCDSNVTGHDDHPALIKVIDSRVKLENSTIRNNTGGLIVYAKNCSQVSIVNSQFVNNHAWECMLCSSQSNVSVENTQISDNFGTFSVVYLVKTTATLGGRVTYSNNTGSFLVRRSALDLTGNNSFQCCKQTFNNFSLAENYRAQGTLTVIQSTIYLYGSTIFCNNHSDKSGGAMYVSETMMFIYGNLKVAGNKAERNGGGAFFYASRVFCSAECSFTNNNALYAGGAISAVDSLIMLRNSKYWPQSISLGLLDVSDNEAHIGGGIYLEINSKIYGLESNHFQYKIVFSDNHAVFKGGAIYVNDSTYPSICASKSYMHYDVHTECFFQILVDDEDTDPGVHNSNISFTDNTANNNRSIVFGGLLDRCTVSPMATVYNRTFHSDQHITPWHALTYFQNVTGTFDELDGFNSDGLRICFCQDNVTDCAYDGPIVEVKRGEEFNITVTVVDQVNRSSSENMPIGIYLIPESGPSKLGKGQQLQFVAKECFPLYLSIFSPIETRNVTLVVYVDDSPCMDAGLSNRTVAVYFKNCNCPIGFQENDQSEDRCDCICHRNISDYVTMCNSEIATFLKKRNSWIGYVDHNNNTGYLVYPNCPYDFCKPPPTINISLNNSNDLYAEDQCAYNRTGLLCGRCREGFHLSTATPRCLNCSSQSSIGIYIAVTILGGVSGIVMVLFFLMLNVTVAQGTINGLIFYANIVLMGRSLFFPSLHPNFWTVFIYLLNNRFGVDRCLPAGVDQYGKMWLYFLFPVYALSLVVVIILFSKYSSRCARTIGKCNPVATLATIILLVYTLLLQVVTDILSFAVLHYPNGSREVVWLPDASVKYFKGKHIPLFLVAVFVLVLGCVYTSLLFAWQWLIRAPNRFMFRWIRNTKLHSFMEAYHAPYKPKYRYWTGLLLFIRVVLNIIVMANKSGNPRTNLLAITILVAFLFLLKAYLGDSIYKQRWLDYLETTYYFNLLLFSLVSFHSSDNPRNQRAAVRVSVSITFTMTMCTLVYHIHYTLCGIKRYKKASESILRWISRKKGGATNINMGENSKVHYKPTNTEVWLSNSLACSAEQKTSERLKTCTLNLCTRENVTESQVNEHCTNDLREPLLEQL